MSTGAAGLEAVIEALGARGQRRAPLGARTTYRVGGPAAVLVEVNNEDELSAVHAALVDGTARSAAPASASASASASVSVPVLVLGNGSNTLVADAGFEGVAVVLGSGLGAIAISRSTVRAGGSAMLPLVARRTAAAGLRGLEWAVGVPGTVGGALKMNAGGHGSDTAARLVRQRVFDLASGLVVEGTPEDLELGYRRSSLGASQVVVWAEFDLTPGSVTAAQAEVSEIVRWRRAHQPGGSNAGSVFTNPPGDAAGRLVEAVGLKGFRLGTARVSDKHANFIQADEGGSADDVARLIEHVRRTVLDQAGVDLVPEVRLVGFNQGESDEPSTSCRGPEPPRGRPFGGTAP
jgi:UDP-N-acetylmuramate dehydrogenase